MKFAQYWKAVVAAGAPVFMVVQSAVSDNGVTSDEWVKIGTAAVAALLVWAVPNAQKARATDRARM